MGHSGIDQDLGRRIAREHAQLGETLRKIETELARLGTTRERPHGNLIRLLASFDKHMRCHFAFEEEGGPLAGVGKDPSAARLANVIVRDHRKLEKELSQILIELGEPRTPTTEQVIDSVRAFLRGLREHETRENQIFQELLYRDVGGED